MKKENKRLESNIKTIPPTDHYIITWIKPNNILKYRGKQFSIPNLTSERFKIFASFRDKLKGDVVSDLDYGLLVPELLNPTLFSANEIKIFSSIMIDWVKDTIKRYPDKKDDLTELKNFIQAHASEIVNNIIRDEEIISAPEIKKIKKRYALLMELGIIDYLHKTYPKLHETKVKKQLISMITGYNPEQLHLYVTYERDENNANYPRGKNNKIAIEVWDELKSIGIIKPNDKK